LLMKRKYLYLSVCVTLCLLAAFAAHMVFFRETTAAPDPSFSKVPGRLASIGPFGRGISVTENIGAYSLSMSAGMVNVKKSRFLGFSTSLKKTMVSKDVTITVYKNGERKLELYKDRLFLDPAGTVLVIRNPKVIFPENMTQPGSVTIDREHEILTIRYRDREDRWNLSG